MQDLKFEVVDKTSQLRMKARDLGRISKFESISPPSVFIGSKLKYPNVNVGILSPIDRVDDAGLFDDVQKWAREDFSIPDVLKLRESLLNSRFQSKVTDARLNNKFVEIAKNIAIASRPVDVEIELKNQLNVGKRVDRVLTPHGMNANLKNWIEFILLLAIQGFLCIVYGLIVFVLLNSLNLFTIFLIVLIETFLSYVSVKYFGNIFIKEKLPRFHVKLPRTC